jgi:hypothetical protein
MHLYAIKVRSTSYISNLCIKMKIAKCCKDVRIYAKSLKPLSMKTSSKEEEDINCMDSSHPPPKLYLHGQMEKLIRKGAPVYIAHCHQMEILASKVVHYQHPEIEALIQKYDKVFQDLPMNFPPERKIEHIIEVKPGSTLVNIKPY